MLPLAPCGGRCCVGTRLHWCPQPGDMCHPLLAWSLPWCFFPQEIGSGGHRFSASHGTELNVGSPMSQAAWEVSSRWPCVSASGQLCSPGMHTKASVLWCVLSPPVVNTQSYWDQRPRACALLCCPVPG